MGVHGLWKLIEPSGKPVPLETLQNKVLAVDVSIWLHQAIKGFQDNKGATVPNAHLLGIYHRVCKLLYFKIKPVFVFDGGVPALKQETMAKRNQLRARNLSDAKKIQKQLLNTLLKHTAVTKVLSERTKSSLPVDSKAVKQSEHNDIYVLPPSQLDSTISSSDEEDYTSGSSSSPTKHWDIHNVDEKSQAFLSLPADVRHEILTDLKETRKQNSWGRIHELPTQSDDFSVYQMKRLLKRFSIQTSLEDAEKEMGGKTLSLGELESLLNDHGIMTEEVGKRIASDENTRYLYIKDVKKALEKARVEESSKLKQIDEEDEAKISDVEKISEHDLEYQKDLELAILLSLESGPSTSKVTNEPSTSGSSRNKQENNAAMNKEINDKKENKKFSAAMSYMMEYSGLTPSSIEQIISSNDGKGKEIKATHVGVADVIDSSDEEMIEINKLIRKQQEEEIASKSNENGEEGERVMKVTELNEDKQGGEIGRKIKKSLEDLQENSSECSDLDESKYFKNKSKQQITVNEEIESRNSNENKNIISKSSDVEDVEGIQGSKSELENINSSNQDAETRKNSEASQEFVEDSVEIMSSHSESSNDFIDVPSKTEKLVQNVEIMSSDSESSVDFIDVPEENTVEHSNNEKKLEIVIKTDENLQDDIFSDIFADDSNATTGIADVLKMSLENLNKSKIIQEKSLQITQEQREGKDGQEKQVEDKEKQQGDKEAKEKQLEDKEKHQGDKEIREKLLEDKEKRQEDKEAKEKQQEDNEAKEKQQEDEEKQVENEEKLQEGKEEEDEEEQGSKESKIAAVVNEDVEIKEEPQDLNTTNTELTQRNLVKEVVESLGKSSSEAPEVTTAELKSLEANLLREKSDIITERSTKERMAGNITDQMRQEAQELLQLFGVPYIVAPMEAEAQCAFLNEINLTDGTITDDSDIWLFGGKTVYKNFFNQNKVVMEYRVENIEHNFKLTRQQLVLLALLVGSDYTTGIQGVGPVTALEILAAFPSSKNNETLSYQQLAQGLIEFRNWFRKGRVAGPGRATLRSKLKNVEFTDNFPSVNVIHAYYEPEIETSREKFTWSRPDIETLTDYAKKKFGWNQKKSEEILKPVMKRLEENRVQTSLHDYFRTKHKISSPDLTNKLSKRVKKAVDRIGGEVEDVEEKTRKPRRKIERDVGVEKKTRRPRKKAADKFEMEKNTKEGVVEEEGRADIELETLDRLRNVEVEKKSQKAVDGIAANIELEKNTLVGIRNIEVEKISQKTVDRIAGSIGEKEKKTRKPMKKAVDGIAANIKLENNTLDGIRNIEVEKINQKPVDRIAEKEKQTRKPRKKAEDDIKMAGVSGEVAKKKVIRGPRRKVQVEEANGSVENQEVKSNLAKRPINKGLGEDEDIKILKLTEEFSSERAKQIEEKARKELEAAKKAVPIRLHKRETIPQKLQTKSDLMKNKMKAIEVFRKSKQGPGFLKRRQKLIRKPKDDAELSESSSSD